MSRIREKATESEAVVRNITKDIQVLDLAKKNLILSMTTLKRLQMLGVCPAADCQYQDTAEPSRSKCSHSIGGSCQRQELSGDRPDSFGTITPRLISLGAR